MPGWLTSIYALFQALSGYGFSYLYTASQGNYRLIYAGAAAALTLALAADFLPWRWRRRTAGGNAGPHA